MRPTDGLVNLPHAKIDIDHAPSVSNSNTALPTGRISLEIAQTFPAFFSPKTKPLDEARLLPDVLSKETSKGGESRMLKRTWESI
jgi:hypothetical protein